MTDHFDEPHRPALQEGARREVTRQRLSLERGPRPAISPPDCNPPRPIPLPTSGRLYGLSAHEAAHWIDALEAKLWQASSPGTGATATPAPGEAFADDEQRSTAAMLIAAIAVIATHDRACGLYWMERAGRWGCQDCAKVMSSVDYSSAGLPSEAGAPELKSLGVRIVVPPYRGRWAAGTIDSNGQATQGLRLDPGTPAGKMFAVLEPEGGSDCGTPMLKLELGERLQRVSLPALDPNATLFDGGHPFALESEPGTYTLCRDLPSGHMLVLLVAADPDQLRGWVKLAYDQSRPMVDEIARAMSH